MTDTITIPTLPTNATEAIDFALAHLEPYEVAEFLTEWRGGKDLKPWLDAWLYDRAA